MYTNKAFKSNPPPLSCSHKKELPLPKVFLYTGSPPGGRERGEGCARCWVQWLLLYQKALGHSGDGHCKSAGRRGGASREHQKHSQRDKWVQLLCCTSLKPLVPRQATPFVLSGCWQLGQGNTRGERSFTECALCLACPRALKGLNNRNHRQN